MRELHDEPHLEGRRITVQFLKEQVEERGLSPRTVADRHDLDVADVYRALTYYHDHPEEMRTIERQRQSAIEEHDHLTTDPDSVRD
ncbi:putative antitoxin of wHTH fold [Halapricum desulfuricans]|uniref:Putative antitoxin of wHTH fold n=1 Tax=Halapricum desulfuricans TaxID=2841257 RepID=A0A897N853_9EURY|nr:putative antitoxin of wHTH fold [Halapricum desulfuricans]